MIVRPLSASELRTILRRQEAIQRHQPKCKCGSDQVQIMFKGTPARWRCRRCKTWFTSEPGDAVSTQKEPS